jgi:biopolymer transport protein ExbD
MQLTENFSRRSPKSFARPQKHILHIDMTPLVDLGFLLITFFVFTTTVSSPAATDLFMPKDSDVTDPSKLPRSLALTALLDGGNRIWYYPGNWEDAVRTGAIRETGYSHYTGLGSVIRLQQKLIDENRKFPEGRKGLMLLIKPAGNASYKNVVDALDEVMINDVKKYAIVEPESEELKFLEQRKSSGH